MSLLLFGRLFRSREDGVLRVDFEEMAEFLSLHFADFVDGTVVVAVTTAAGSGVDVDEVVTAAFDDAVAAAVDDADTAAVDDTVTAAAADEMLDVLGISMLTVNRTSSSFFASADVEEEEEEEEEAEEESLRELAREVAMEDG